MTSTAASAISEKTPEPQPQVGPAEGNRFVVHRHEARNLHYDLRIEAGGVLACWAVPKGFSYLPADKRLAVRTEDHPLMYESFEGSIPRGQYGAGTMRIWDAGTYEVRKAKGIAQALEKGELKLELRGRRLRGEWHLVRTKQEQGKNWLLFKARDRYAGSGSDLFAGADMSRAVQKPLPRRLTRMEAETGEEPFDDPDWLFEPAFPGRRVLARVEDTQVSLQAGAEDLSGRLPAIAKALAGVRARTALLDGIVVALDPQGRPSEQALALELEQGGAAGSTGSGAVLYLFDLLYAEDWDLRGLPLRERKAALRGLLPDSGRLALIDPVAERGLALASAAGASGLPAIVAKRAGSAYRAGVSKDWLRIPVSAAPAGSAKGSAKAAPARGRKAAEALPRSYQQSAQGLLARAGLHQRRPGGLLRPGGRFPAALPAGPAPAPVPLARRDPRQVLLPEAAPGGAAEPTGDRECGPRRGGARPVRHVQRPPGAARPWSTRGASTCTPGSRTRAAWTPRTGPCWTWIPRRPPSPA